MSRTKKILVSTGAALGLSSVALAQSANLDIDRAYAAELRADASRHSSLLQSGGSGYDGAFHIGDASGNNRLNIGVLHQFRWIGNFTDNDDSSVVGEDFTNGFEGQRTQIAFTGNIINPQITYDVTLEMGLADRDEDLGVLRNAFIQYNFEGEGSGWYARWGQFKVPLLNEENIHDGKQLAVERGPVNEFFTPSWSEGVMLGYLSDQFGVHFALTDGVRTPLTEWPSTAGTAFAGADADIALSFRGDVKFMGSWEQFDDFTSFRGSDRAFKVGGGIHWQTGGDTGGPTAVSMNTFDADYWMWTIDCQYEADGYNVAAGYVGSTMDVTGSIDTTNHGIYVQGGLFLADQWELFGRWDWLMLDSDFTATGDEDYHYITLGTNYYFVPESHALKFTGDVIWALDESAAGGFTDTVTNLGDTGLLLGTDGEVSLRLQLQVLF
ncbi:MAG: hypothetical protein R3B49_01495 [Phycisphaerales bacterium]